MIVKENTRLEKVLNIYEQDMINGGDLLILTAYAVKENDELWAYPAPQIFNADVYHRNKAVYDQTVIEFRQSCELSELNE